MSNETKNQADTMQAIWGAVGLMLLAIGSVVLGTGIYIVDFHIHERTVLANLHPDVWWGSIMLAVGATFFLINMLRK